MHRMYENDDIVVFWNSEKCFHSKRCVHGSPSCFDPKRKPWIDLNQADNAEIWKAIDACPSKALGCLYKHNIEVAMDAENCRSIALDGDNIIGECQYDVTENVWNIYHTGVKPEYNGKGIAKRLVYKVIEEAERNAACIDATCSYAIKILEET